MGENAREIKGGSTFVFEINYTNSEAMFEEFQKNLKKIEGIEQFFDLHQELFGNDFVCWGDDRIEKIEYYNNSLKVTIVSELNDYSGKYKYNGKSVKKIYYDLEFYDVELYWFSIATYVEHFINEVYIQQNDDGKYSISFDAGELDFRYASAKAKSYHIIYEE